MCYFFLANKICCCCWIPILKRTATKILSLGSWAMPHISKKFHQNPLITFGDTLFTRNDYTQTDRNTRTREHNQLCSCWHYATANKFKCNNDKITTIPKSSHVEDLGKPGVTQKTGFIQTLKHYFPGLAKTKFQGIQDSKNVFSRTFQDTFRSQTWLHEVKKCTYQISFRCNCITLNKPKCSTCGDKMHTMYYNEFLL